MAIFWFQTSAGRTYVMPASRVVLIEGGQDPALGGHAFTAGHRLPPGGSSAPPDPKPGVLVHLQGASAPLPAVEPLSVLADRLRLAFASQS
jgi:hypothetical protein